MSNLTPRDVWIGLACAVLVVIAWSGFIVLSRAGALGVLMPTDLVALRFGVAALVMLPVFFWKGRGFGGLRVPQVLALASTAGLGFAFFAMLGFSLAPAAHGSVLMPGTLPFFAAITCWFILKESPSLRKLIGLGIIAVGVLALALGSFTTDPTGTTWLGDLSFLAGSASWAVYLALTRRWRVSPLDGTVAIALGAAAMYLPVYWLFLPGALMDAPWSQWVIHGGYQGLVSVVLNTLLYTRMVATFGPTVSTMITALVPGVAAVAAVPLLGEPLTTAALVGLVAVTVGMVVGVTGAPRR